MEFPNLSPKYADQIDRFYGRYEIVGKIAYPKSNETLVDPIRHKCRFCKQEQPAVKFKHRSHAIPELLGNKRIFAEYECDQCNDYFSSALEDHLGKFLGIGRTLTQMKGKRGIPTYNPKENGGRIDITDTEVLIKDWGSDRIATIDSDDKSMIVKGICQPYIPLSVYKCFVKIALSVMPYDLIDTFKGAIKWVRYGLSNGETHLVKPCYLIQKFMPGWKPIEGVSTILLRRKQLKDRVPYMFFVMAAGNYQFQITVPCPAMDYHLLGSKVSMPPFPTPIELSKRPSEHIGTELFDLSSNVLLKNDPCYIKMKFDGFEKEEFADSDSDD